MFVNMKDHAEKYILNLSFIDNDIISYWPIMNDLLLTFQSFNFPIMKAVIGKINKCIVLINAYRIE